jgi:hypothetical protein
MMRTDCSPAIVRRPDDFRPPLARERSSTRTDRAARYIVRALRECEHCGTTRAASTARHAVIKLLLIIDDCRTPAIASLQKRHTLSDNAGWDTLSARRQALLNCHTRSGGYPRFPLKEIAVCRTAYVESNRKDLVFGQVPCITSGLLQTNFTPTCRLRRPTSFAQICKLIQNIMTRLGDPLPSAPARLGVTRLRAACVKSLQGAPAVLFSPCRWATGGFQ